jgi:hypothetical protein
VLQSSCPLFGLEFDSRHFQAARGSDKAHGVLVPALGVEAEAEKACYSSKDIHGEEVI